MQTKTFRGMSLAEVETKVRAELGDDAVIVRSREGLTGGVGGVFQRRVFEVEAVGGHGGPAGGRGGFLPAPCLGGGAGGGNRRPGPARPRRAGAGARADAGPRRRRR